MQKIRKILRAVLEERPKKSKKIFFGHLIPYNLIKVSLSVCPSVCMLVRNRLPNHAYYGDEAFAGDSVGLRLGQRLNFIFKNIFQGTFRGKLPLMKKILFE